MARIAIFDIEEWEKEHITGDIDEEIIFFSEKLTAEKAETVSDCEVLVVFIYSNVSKEILDKMPNLKLISTMSTGFDHIDMEECASRDIKVCNVPSYGENTVAEHTFALILALSRKLVKAVDRARKGDFNLEGLRGFDLRGRTLGIVGCGRIGMHAAKIARGFEMKVVVFDVNQDEKLAQEIGFEYVGLDSLLSQSDIISLHAPYNEHTHHMINRESIEKMKDGAMIINTARGGLIETEALFSALKTGRVSGAALDVLEEETTIKEEKELLSHEFREKANLATVLENHVLMNMENVIITPHNAFNSEEALMRIVNTTVSNIKGFLEGKIINQVRK